MRVVASTGRPWLAWLMLLVWSAWLAVGQAWIGLRAGFAPDLGLVLLLGCAGRFDPRDLPRCALCVALGRAAFSVEPAVGLLAGYLSIALALRALRIVLELTGGLQRALLALPLAVANGCWLELVHRARDGELIAALGQVETFAGFASTGLATAVAAALASPLLLYLPGLTPLRRQGTRPLGRRALRRIGRGEGRVAF